jgi:hypothetical protein
VRVGLRGEAVIAASDVTARAAYDLEFILGEGPARLAVARSHAVQVAGTALCDRWPQYGASVAKLGVQAVIVVPLEPPARPGALELLRARAFSVGRPAEEIAAGVLRGELRLC